MKRACILVVLKTSAYLDRQAGGVSCVPATSNSSSFAQCLKQSGIGPTNNKQDYYFQTTGAFSI
jgi:hypothetical protein